MTLLPALLAAFALTGTTGDPPAPPPPPPDAAEANAPPAEPPPLAYPLRTVIERIACDPDPTQTYAARLPSAYEGAAPLPVILVMDPRGRAVLALDLFAEAAERFGWIVASSWDTLSDGPRAPNERAIRAMLPDIQRRFRVDPQRIYLAGFSGTARVAWDFAYRIRGVAGILGIGGGLPFELKSLKAGDFVYYGAAGNEDFNYEEMRALDAKLDAVGIQHRVTFFDGPHDWCPADRCAEAIAWLEMQAMIRGLRAPDPAFIESRFASMTARARALESAGSLPEARDLYRDIATDFSALRDVSAARVKDEELSKDREVRRAEARDARFAREQARYEATLYDFVAAFRKSGPFPMARSLAQLQIRPILERAEDPSDPVAALAAKRQLELAFSNISFYETRDYLEAGDWERAEGMLEIAGHIKPRHPRVCYGLARVRAQRGRVSEALDALECAVDSGAVPAELIEEDRYLAPLRTEARYRAILSRLEADTQGK